VIVGDGHSEDRVGMPEEGGEGYLLGDFASDFGADLGAEEGGCCGCCGCFCC